MSVSLEPRSVHGLLIKERQRGIRVTWFILATCGWHARAAQTECLTWWSSTFTIIKKSISRFDWRHHLQLPDKVLNRHDGGKQISAELAFIVLGDFKILEPINKYIFLNKFWYTIYWDARTNGRNSTQNPLVGGVPVGNTRTYGKIVKVATHKEHVVLLLYVTGWPAQIFVKTNYTNINNI